MGCGFAHPLYGGGMLLSVAKGAGTKGRERGGGVFVAAGAMMAVL